MLGGMLTDGRRPLTFDCRWHSPLDGTCGWRITLKAVLRVCHCLGREDNSSLTVHTLTT